MAAALLGAAALATVTRRFAHDAFVGRSVAPRRRAEAVDNCTDPEMPRYFIRNGTPSNPKNFYGYPEICDQDLSRGFAQQLDENPCRTSNETVADFVFLCCWTNPNQLTELLSLPARSPRKPYVIFMATRQLGERGAELVRRRDVLFLAMDLREASQLKSDAPPLPGVTIAPGQFFIGFRHDKMLRRPPRYLLTFRGAPNAIDNTVRLDLRESLSTYYASGDARADVKVCVDPQCTADFPQFGPMMDAAFVLCPRGHGRWSYRLSEVMGACAIPVFMSDGITLPFEPLVNWTEFSLQLPEKMAKGDFQAIIDRLPKDWETISRMRKRACEVNNLYFETERRRLEGAVKSIKRYLQDLGGERPEPR